MWPRYDLGKSKIGCGFSDCRNVWQTRNVPRGARGEHGTGRRVRRRIEPLPGRPRTLRKRKTLTLHLLRIRFSKFMHQRALHSPHQSKSGRIVKQMLGAGLCGLRGYGGGIIGDGCGLRLRLLRRSRSMTGAAAPASAASSVAPGPPTSDVSDPGLGIIGTALGVPVIQTTNSNGFIGGIEGARTISSASWSSAGSDITWGRLKGTQAPTASPGRAMAAPAALSRTMTVDTNLRPRRAGLASRTTTGFFSGKAGVAWANNSYTDAWGQRRPVALHRNGQQQDPDRWTVGTGLESGSSSQLVAQDRIRLSRLRHQDGRHQRRDHAGRRRDPRVIGAQNQQHINEAQGGINWRFAQPLVTRIFS